MGQSSFVYEKPCMVHYDESYKSIIEAVKTQLKFKVRIPADFSEYAIKIIENWWKQGY